MSDWDVSKYLRVLSKWWYLLALSVVVASVVSFGATRVMKPTYRASVTILVGEDQANPQVKPEDIAASLRMSASYAGAVRRQPVLAGAIKSLGLNMDWQELQDNVLVIRVENTPYFEIRVTDSSAERSAALANELARQLILQSPTEQAMQQLDERRSFARTQLDTLQVNIDAAQSALQDRKAALDQETSARAIMDLKDEIKALELKTADWRSAYATLAAAFPTRGPSTITVIAPATPPRQPTSPNVTANVAMATLAGLLLALSAIFLVEYLQSSKLSTPEDLTRFKGFAPLGAITDAKDLIVPSVKRPVSLSNPNSPIAEAYRVLRTNVQFAWGARGGMTLLVTSPSGGEGKTTTSANLAIAFARAGKRTVLVDADLRHPSVADVFGVASSNGLTELFRDDPTASDSQTPAEAMKGRVANALVQTEVPNLSILPTGPLSQENPAEVLASGRIEPVITALGQMAEVVILDSSPVLPVADAAILGSMGVGVLLVAKAGETTSEALRLAAVRLETVQARVLGLVLNRAPRPAASYYEYRQRPAEAKRRRPSVRMIRPA